MERDRLPEHHYNRWAPDIAVYKHATMTVKMRTVDVVGAGPAGSAAALAALAAGAPVRLFEKSVLPRHRVCGEFLSPGIDTVLDRLGAWDGFARLAPARIARAVLSFNGREVRFPLARPAYGLSRFALDKMLADLAVSRGAEFHREAARAGHVIAHGRVTPAPRGRRLFGFKAHFAGPADDAVRLFFFGGCYAGVSAIEGGLTNVCGLAPENLLRGGRFQPETVLELSRAARRPHRAASASHGLDRDRSPGVPRGLSGPRRGGNLPRRAMRWGLWTRLPARACSVP